MQNSLWCRNDCEVENIFNRHHCRPIRPISSVKVIAREGGLSAIASDVLNSVGSSNLVLMSYIFSIWLLSFSVLVWLKLMDCFDQ